MQSLCKEWSVDPTSGFDKKVNKLWSNYKNEILPDDY